MSIIEAKEAYQTELGQLNENKERLNAVLERIKQVEENIPELEAQIAEAQKESELALRKVGYGELTESELKAAKAKVKQLNQELEDAHSLKSSLTHSQRELEGMVYGHGYGQEGRVRDSLTRYCDAIAKEMMDKIRADKKLLNAMHEAFTAWAYTGGDYDRFVTELFDGEELTNDHYGKLRADFEKKYIAPIAGEA